MLELAERIRKDHAVLDEVTLVFPNRRAVLYFRKHLGSLLESPAFAPSITTVEDFISGFSTLRVPDKFELVFRLYNTYNTYNTVLGHPEGKDAEPFDQFYFWGEMLLRDFDEVDKYLVRADQLFRDLSNQKELDSSFDYLTPEQVEYLKSFWGNFADDLTVNKKRFLQVWRQLPEVYLAFRKQLKDEGLAYEGMLHREVAEQFKDGSPAPETKRIIFAGFNALTAVEERIMTSLVERGLAEIHWDIDNYYVNNMTQEAGVFFRNYQQHSVLGKTFPSDVPSHFNIPKKVRVAGAAQHVGQAKLMAQFLKEQLEQGIDPEDTLIVLPDEKMLLPVLHGISGFVDKLNVTMGFPLASTPMFNLVEFLVELQSNRREEDFNHRQVLSILSHPYIVAADPAYANSRRKEIIEKNRIIIQPAELAAGPSVYPFIFKSIRDSSLTGYIRDIIQSIGSMPGITDLDKEYAFHFLKLINRMEEVAGSLMSAPASETDPARRLQYQLKSFTRLFRQLAKTQKIPFTGEPLKGLQVMGVLETRSLDYKNVFVLSMNEGAMPSSGSKASYIPFNIRKAYSLPTTEHQDAIYAYLFYRVLQRAENVFLFYNTETDVLGQGETSRYLQQLLFESGWKVDHAVLHNPIRPLPVKPIVITKDEKVLEGLVKLNEGNYRFKGISPSALSTYLDCQLKFYFQYVAKMREAREVEEDLDARVVGNFLHEVMERFYKQIQEKKKGSLIEASDLAHHQAVTDGLIDRVFIDNFKLDPDRKVVYEGQRLVVREVIRAFVDRIVRHDQRYAPFTIEGLEREGLLYYIPISHTPGQAVLGGKIDRLDRKGNVVRVIDYKTGKAKLDFDSIESLFSREETGNRAVFQTLLYALLYKSNYPEAGIRISPGLMNWKNIFEDDFVFGLNLNKSLVEDSGPLMPELEHHLKILLEEIFNPAGTFSQTQNIETCKLCAYSGICYR